MRWLSLKGSRGAALAAIMAMPASALLYFLLEVYLARVLGADGFAQYAAFSAASGILVYVVGLGIPAASTKFVAEYQDTGAISLLAAYVRWSLVTGFSVAVFLGLPLAVLYVWVTSPAGLDLGGAVAIAGASAGLFLWLWSRQVAIGAGIPWIAVVPKELLFPLVLAGVISALSISTFAGLAQAYLLVLILIEVPVCVFLLRRLGRSPCESREKPRVRSWLLVAMPLGIASLASAGLARWDVLSASAVLSNNEVAAYAAAARVALVGGIVQRAFEVVSAKELVRLNLKSSPQLVRCTLRSQARVTGAVAAVMLGLLFVFADVVLELFGDFATAGVVVLRVLVIAQFVHCITAPYDVFMVVGELQRVRAALISAASASALVLTGIGASLYGMLGCAVAMLVSVTAYRLIGAFLVERHLVAAESPR